MQELSSSLDTSWLQKCRANRMVPVRPLYHNTEKHAFKCEVILWQISFGVFIEPSANQDWLNCPFLLKQTKKKLLPMMKSTNYIQESGVRHRHLVAKFENNGARGSRFERVGSHKLKGNGQIGFPLWNFLFLIFLRPQGIFGTKKAKKANTGTPSKMVLFQKTWWKRVKSTLLTSSPKY